MLVPEISLRAPANQIVDQVRQACLSHGFFYLRDFGIPTVETIELLDSMRSFFELNPQQKQEIQRSDSNPWGYYDNELTKNRKDWKEILDIGPDTKRQADTVNPFPNARTQWPAELPQFKGLMQSYMAQCAALSKRLHLLLLQSLDASSNASDATFGADHSSFLRLNYYPLCPNPAPHDADFIPAKGELGISHHTDAGVLTLLLQSDVAGLQFYHQGGWHTVTPKADTFMVNIGDVVQVWSNDQYKAPLHRVLASATQLRYSAAYFYNPSYSDSYAPLPSTGEPLYRPISWAEFRQGRTAGDYADVGEELQISHYKL